MLQATMDASDGSDGSIDSVEISDDDALPEDEEIADDDSHAVAPAKSGKKNGSAERVVISKSTRERTRGVGKSVSMRSGTAGTAPRIRRTADSNWGNASSPAMSLSELMGGDKKSIGGAGGADKSVRSSRSVASATGRKTLMHNRLGSKKKEEAKNDRRQEVKNSLAKFLHANNEADASDVEEEEEDDYLISDEEKEELNSDIEKSDGERSQKSSKSQSRRVRRPPRKTGGGGGGDDASVVSSASRRRPPRRRINKPDADDATVESSTGRRSRISSRHRDLGDDPSVGSVKPMRVQGERQKRSEGTHRSSKDTAVPRRKTSKTADEEDTTATAPKKTTSKTTVDENEEKKPHKPRKKHSKADSDDRSVGSRKSKSSRRKPTESSRKKHHSPSKSKDDDDTATAPSSPGCSTGDRKSHTKKPLKHKAPSLSRHIEADPDATKNQDDEEESEESSRLSHGYSHTLLQFDPTNENHVTCVTQDGAHVTSEKVRFADGTESDLQIHELTGLPTFEIQPIYQDSAGSGLSLYDDDAATQVSQESHTDQEQAKHGRPSSDRTCETAPVQSTGEKSESDEKIGDEALTDGKEKTPKIKRSLSGGSRLRQVASSRSFLRRNRDTPATSKDIEEGEEKPSSGKGFGFFGRSKKKDESDSDGEEKDRFGRKKRKPKSLAHQALDDDDSE
jgi:hypothetical protein